MKKAACEHDPMTVTTCACGESVCCDCINEHIDRVQTDQFSQAIPELQKAYAIESTGSAAGYLGYAYAASGDRTRARRY